MNIIEFRDFYRSELEKTNKESDYIFKILLKELCNIDPLKIALDPSFIIKPKYEMLLKASLKNILRNYPLDYIINKKCFFGYDFYVDENVLIPRPETEELVAWILDSVATNAKIQIMDIGTGTGCIPITLAKNLPKANLFAIDISREALKIATKNAQQHEVKIQFIEKNILEITNLPQKFDIIVSNPPYVRKFEKIEIKNNVLEHEPHIALFVEDDNPLLFYDKIADLSKEHLTKNGLLFFEINQYLGTETVEMLHKKGFKNIELRKDIFGKDRMIQCTFNEGDAKI